MIQYLSCFFLLLLFANVLAAPVYKSEDESGNPVFSDRAAESAEQIEVREPSTFKSSLYTRPYKRVQSKPSNTSDDNDNFKYQTLAITSPEDGTAIRDNAGNLTLHFSVVPAIQQGHSLHLMMDGQVYSSLGSSGFVSMQNVDRGTHQFRLTVTRTKDGKVIQTGPTTAITLLRHSRQN
ncbi:MAG: DUF4124 domain-containing protein [Proteobacteria bacterium]|nr:DUF4124 domain-containing protein [Pseudomonadota bacterium]